MSSEPLEPHWASRPEQALTSSVSVIMPVYNGEGFLDRSLPPLLRMVQRGEVREVIVVDDASTDQTSRRAADLGARVVSTGRCRGSAGARNLGACEAGGDLLWFVDADVVVPDDAIAKLLPAFSEPEVAAVFGSYDDRPPQQNFFSLYKNLVHHYYFQHTRRDTFFFWTGCGAVRREAFSRVGGFDPALLSLEDIELGHRLRQAGGRVSLLPDLQCTHLKEWRFIDLIYTEIFCGALPWSRLMLSKTGMVNDLRVSFGERFRALLAGLWLGDVPAVVLGIVPGESLIVLSALVGFMNRNFWRYLSRRKGPGFALAALLYHQVYYLYSGAAFTGCWFEIRIYKKFFSQEKRSPAQDFQASGFPGLPSFRAKPRPEPNE